MTEDIKFIHMLSEHSFEISEKIQRAFEWSREETSMYLEGLLDCSNHFAADKDGCKSLTNFGVATAYKKDKNTTFNYYIDDGGHRFEMSVIAVTAIVRIMEKHGLDADDTYKRLYNNLSDVVEDAKKNFIPHPSDVEDIENILNGKFSASKKQTSKLQDAFAYATYFFEKVYIDNNDEFYNICDFFAKHYSFSVTKNEFCPLAVRKIKYNLINNAVKPQNDIHRSISTLSQDAYALGVEMFMEKVNMAKEKINERFPQTNKDKQNNNPYMGLYLMLKILSEEGKVCDGKPTDKLKKLTSKIVLNLTEEERKAFYETLFDDVEMFCNLMSGSLGFDMAPSTNNSINMFTIASFSNVMSDRGKSRCYIGSIYFRIAKSLLKFNGAKVVGVKEGFTETKVWNLFRLLYLFRFYTMSTVARGGDERNCLAPVVTNYGGKIENDADVDKYIDFFFDKVEKALKEYSYVTTRFENYTYSSKYTKFFLFLISGEGKNMYEKLRNVARKYMCGRDYDMDHIVTISVANGDEILKRKLNSMGNLRVLDGRRNRQENVTTKSRFIDESDISFPEEMRGKDFTIQNIDARQQWMADKIRDINKFIYEFEFK